MYSLLKKKVRRFAKVLLAEEEKNISVQLQRLAGVETARYVQSKMSKVKAFSSQEEVMRYALAVSYTHLYLIKLAFFKEC